MSSERPHQRMQQKLPSLQIDSSSLTLQRGFLLPGSDDCLELGELAKVEAESPERFPHYPYRLRTAVVADLHQNTSILGRFSLELGFPVWCVKLS